MKLAQNRKVLNWAKLSRQVPTAEGFRPSLQLTPSGSWLDPSCSRASLVSCSSISCSTHWPRCCSLKDSHHFKNCRDQSQGGLQPQTQAFLLQVGQRGWNLMVFKAPSDPNPSTILWLENLLHLFRTVQGTKYMTRANLCLPYLFWIFANLQALAGTWTFLVFKWVWIPGWTFSQLWVEQSYKIMTCWK